MIKWRIGLTVAFIIGMISASTYLATPPVRSFDARQARQDALQYQVRVVRDAYGVPHIYGARNADVAFGLAYAHAQDDWATIEEVLRFSRGELARTTGREGAITDFLVRAIKVEEAVASLYEQDIPQETKAILEGYAAGANLYCAEEPGRCGSDVAPITPQDIVAGFVSRTPFFYGLDKDLQTIFAPADEVKQAYFRLQPGEGFGSNAAAVSPRRSADGHTRLLVNSHQPFTGPVAWYEARLKSEEGWDMIGGLFPGAPLVLHGATPDLGWAFTVNAPDLVDIFTLQVDDPDKPTQYRLGDQWLDFETGQAQFRVKLFGPFSLPVSRPLYWTNRQGGLVWLAVDGWSVFSILYTL